MKKRLLTAALLVGMLFTVAAVDPECDNSDAVTTARSGVSIASAKVSVQADGTTLEQSNVKHRLEMENTPGAIQHLYILSAYSGQVLLYSTVKGKVTSSGKRLSPTQRAVTGYSADYHPELIGDDGTYGTSIEYLYWWDVKGVYRQIYVTGGTFTVISDQPQQFGRVTMQAEIRK
jgi:pullulanase/glycogen debranching enzyme